MSNQLDSLSAHLIRWVGLSVQRTLAASGENNRITDASKDKKLEKKQFISN